MKQINVISNQGIKLVFQANGKKISYCNVAVDSDSTFKFVVTGNVELIYVEVSECDEGGDGCNCRHKKYGYIYDGKKTNSQRNGFEEFYYPGKYVFMNFLAKRYENPIHLLPRQGELICYLYNPETKEFDIKAGSWPLYQYWY